MIVIPREAVRARVSVGTDVLPASSVVQMDTEGTVVAVFGGDDLPAGHCPGCGAATYTRHGHRPGCVVA